MASNENKQEKNTGVCGQPANELKIHWWPQYFESPACYNSRRFPEK